MSRSIPVLCANAANRILNPLGLRLSRFPTPADRRRMRLLERHSISTVIDIGANAGQYGTHLRRLGYRARLQSYEPQPHAFRALAARASADPQWSAVQKAVSDRPGTVTLHVSANSVSSSLLPMAGRHMDAVPDSREVAAISVESMSLAEILEPLRDERIMVKIDVQGHEKSVLESGGALLADVRLVELELSLVPLYENQALFREVDRLLVDQGFALASLEDAFFDERSGELLQMDGIYARR